MAELRCRFCRGTTGEVVLDLGEQPACDHFPPVADPEPDPAYPLQMWLCAACGLAQLVADPTVPEEPRGAEPAALVAQSHDAVDRVRRAGWLRPGASVVEFGSPHGGSWLPLLPGHDVTGGPADVVLDCFGLMHSADQAAAVEQRVARLAPDGVLLVQYHSLATIVEHGQWNSLRHGHYAYYSTPTLVGMLGRVGLRARAAWRFDLYGGTLLLAATRAGTPDDVVTELLATERRARVHDPAALRDLQRVATESAANLYSWLTERRTAGLRVLGYGAASRAVSLLARAGIGPDLLPAIADASPAKQGARMPGVGVPVITPEQLVAERPDEVLLLLPDLMIEVRRALPTVDRWVDIDHVTRGGSRVG